ncbi:MAG: sugar ABC transporter substrate-binding protein [bacterium]
MKKRVTVLMLALALTLGLVMSGVASGSASAAEKKVVLGLTLEHLGNPFYATLKKAAGEQAKKMGVEIITLGVRYSTDIESQVRLLEDFIAKGVDVVGYAAVDSDAIVPALKKVKAAGIPIICVDTKANWGGDETYISTDNYLGGYYGGMWLAEAIGKKGKIGIVEGTPSYVCLLRKKGFTEALKLYPDVEIRVILAANWRRDLGLKVTEDMITGFPDLQGIFFLNDEMAMGGIQALRTAGRDDVITLGYNGSPDAIQAVYEGKLDADVVQYPERMGRLFVIKALEVLEGKKLPEYINSGVGVVDTDELQKSYAVITGEFMK